ncbi:transposase family protein, partial [Niastella vici]|uniref:transposase family protein n=1 Tax=Niastella vici TaxID=1703345 RepID=UPI00117D3453
MLLHELLFEDKAGNFEIKSTIRESGKVILHVSSTRGKNTCPDCNVNSTRLHSYYFRKVKDLPILGYSIVLSLRVGKFYCKNSKCSRKVFSQRFPVHFLPYKRNTVRLDDKLL